MCINMLGPEHVKDLDVKAVIQHWRKLKKQGRYERNLLYGIPRSYENDLFMDNRV